MKIEYYACDVCKTRVDENNLNAVALTASTGEFIDKSHPLLGPMGKVPETVSVLACSPECAITFLMTRAGTPLGVPD